MPKLRRRGGDGGPRRAPPARAGEARAVAVDRARDAGEDLVEVGGCEARPGAGLGSGHEAGVVGWSPGEEEARGRGCCYLERGCSWYRRRCGDC